MPDFPIVDAHLHLWDPEHFRMPWLDGSKTLNKRFSLPELKEHTRGVDVGAFVYLQVDVAPPYALLEAKWVAERAKEDSRIQAIVAWAPTEYGERVRLFLEGLKEVSPLVKGVRRIVQGEADVNYCLDKDFLRGVEITGELGLSFDICIRSQQVQSSTELVKRCPKTQFVLDHIGKPDIKNHVLDPWRADIKNLAALPNVVCKISGMVTEADHDRWTANDLEPYVQHVLESFGEDRVMFGGDWPVSTQASTYKRWVETLDKLTSKLPAGALKKLYAENAKKFYRL